MSRHMQAVRANEVNNYCCSDASSYETVFLRKYLVHPFGFICQVCIPVDGGNEFIY